MGDFILSKNFNKKVQDVLSHQLLIFSLVDPLLYCNNMVALQTFCNQAAKKKGLLPKDGSLKFLNSYPKCINAYTSFSDVPGDSDIRVLHCCSSPDNLMYFSIVKGESKYGAYELSCYQLICTAIGNIQSVFGQWNFIYNSVIPTQMKNFQV